MTNRVILPGLLTVSALAFAGVPTRALAQQPASRRAVQTADTVVVEAGPEYAAGALHKLLLGQHYRDLWTTPIRVPVLDLGRFAGGLEPEEEGGNQTRTLHMKGADGREYIFRSIHKDAQNALPHDARHSPVGRVAEDQVSSLHPAATLMVPPLLEAADLLYARPQLVVMPDDPRLGRFHDRFAGLLGEIEVMPNEGKDDTRGFAGSSKVVKTFTLYDDLEESASDRVDEGEYARARLIDFLIGDPDRGTDQWRWARFDEGDEHVWRPIPRDRDWAFVDADGALLPLTRMFYVKLVGFGHDYPPISALTFSSHDVDRRLLTRLDRAAWDSITAALQARLTDDVLREVVDAMPAPYAEKSGAMIFERLRDRRERMPEVVDAFYEWLAADVDVRGTDEPEIAELERLSDGRLDVRIRTVAGAVAAGDDGGSDDGRAASAEHTYYHRVFLPDETEEVRVYLRGGDDRAVVRGPSDRITIRLIGGGGDDVLVDSSGAGDVHLYDAKDGHRFVTTPRTHTDTRDWKTVTPPEGIRAGSGWAPDYGEGLGVGGALDYREGSGFILGAGPVYTAHGFRRYPYASRAALKVLYAPGSGRAALDLRADRRLENSPLELAVHARASALEALRFFGYGNDTDRVSSDLSLVRYRELMLEPELVWHIGWRRDIEPLAPATGEMKASFDSARAEQLREIGPPVGELAVGAIARYTDPSFPLGAPLSLTSPTGRDPYGEVGAQMRLAVAATDGHAAPRRGARLKLNAAAFPAVWDAPDAYGIARGEAAVYVPLPALDGPSLALRVGGARAFGSFPIEHAAYLGGRFDLRGYDYDRFAGDAAAYGTVELRAPVGEITLLTRGELGILGFTDAGRVWMDGSSPDGWHAGGGVGAWFATLRHVVYGEWAHSPEGSQVYVGMGLPF